MASTRAWKRLRKATSLYKLYDAYKIFRDETEGEPYCMCHWAIRHRGFILALEKKYYDLGGDDTATHTCTTPDGCWVDGLNEILEALRQEE